MKPQRGFTFLAVLFALGLMAVSALSAVTLSSHLARREREAELLFVGEQYRDAILRYSEANARLADRYPKELAALLKDPSALDTRRYLRKLFLDPLTGSAQWGIVRSRGGGIVGIYSLAEGTPVKRTGFTSRQGEFADAKRYADWRFIAVPADAVAAGGTPDGGTSGADTAASGATVATTGAAAESRPTAAPASPPGIKPPLTTCEYAMAVDRTTCATLRLERGAEVGAACAASAHARAQFCAGNSGAHELPPLDMR